MDRKFNIIDSMIIKPESKFEGYFLPDQKVILSQVSKQTFISYPDASPEFLRRDTLFELKEQKMIPFLKLRFSDESVNNSLMIFNIWRSKRFILAQYRSRQGGAFFLHDLKTNSNSNMKTGFEDDVHLTHKVAIYSLHDNTYYYFATPELSNQKEEPNPDVYIGEFIE
jgi:hypothetical protein